MAQKSEDRIHSGGVFARVYLAYLVCQQLANKMQVYNVYFV